MPRTYSLPVFNLTCNVWKAELANRDDQWPLVRPSRLPDLTPACQLYMAAKAGATSGRVLIGPNATFFGFSGPGIELRLPAGTLVTHPYGTFTGAAYDLIEVPAGSGVFFVCFLALDQLKGFANEQRLAYLAPAFRYGAAEDSTIWDYVRGFQVSKGSL